MHAEVCAGGICLTGLAGCWSCGEAPKLLLESKSPCQSLTKFTWIFPLEPGSSLLVFRALSWYLSDLHTPLPLVQGKLRASNCQSPPLSALLLRQRPDGSLLPTSASFTCPHGSVSPNPLSPSAGAYLERGTCSALLALNGIQQLFSFPRRQRW